MVLTVTQALQLLQLQPGATKQQIRSSYKRLALQLHPDKQQHQHPRQQPTGPCQSSNAFALLSAAYSLLMKGSISSTSNDYNVQQHQDWDAEHDTEQWSWPQFETAYATGALFTEQLLDEAVVVGACPLEMQAM